MDAATDLLDAQSTALTGIVGTVVDALRAGEGYRGNGGLSILCEKPQAVVMPALAKQCWTTLDRLDHSYDSAKKRNGATQERQATHEALNNGYSNRMPTQPPPFPFPPPPSSPIAPPRTATSNTPPGPAGGPPGARTGASGRHSRKAGKAGKAGKAPAAVSAAAASSAATNSSSNIAAPGGSIWATMGTADTAAGKAGKAGKASTNVASEHLMSVAGCTRGEAEEALRNTVDVNAAASYLLGFEVVVDAPSSDSKGNEGKGEDGNPSPSMY